MNQSVSKILFIIFFIYCQNNFAQNLELKVTKDNNESNFTFKKVKTKSNAVDSSNLDVFEMVKYNKQIINELDYIILQKNIIGKWKLISNISITGETSRISTIPEMVFYSNNSWENISNKKNIFIPHSLKRKNGFEKKLRQNPFV